MSPAPYPNPSRTFYSSTTSWLWELQEWRKVVPVPRGAWETLGLLGKDTCRDFPACWPYSGDWEGAQANLWIIVPSFHSSTRTWSFLHRFLNNFWETQKGTQYLGLSLRSLRILLKNSQNPGPRTLLTANCDHTGRKRGKKRKQFLKWQRPEPWRMDLTSCQWDPWLTLEENRRSWRLLPSLHA